MYKRFFHKNFYHKEAQPQQQQQQQSPDGISGCHLNCEVIMKVKTNFSECQSEVDTPATIAIIAKNKYPVWVTQGRNKW